MEKLAAGLTVRVIASEDLPAIVELHMAAFPDSALTRLGSGAVHRYYAWQCDPVHDAVNLVAMKDGRVVGFCFGGVFRGAMTGFLTKHGLFLLAAVAVRPNILFQTRFRARLPVAARLLYRRATRPLHRPRRAPAAGPALPPTFGILAIATDPGQQRAGIGHALMAAVTDEAVRRGFTRMNLSVDPHNEAAVRFYERLGWQRVPAEAWRGQMAQSLCPRSGARH